MNIEKRRAEIAARKAEIRKLIEGDSENKLNMDDLEKELRELNEEDEKLEKRQAIERMLNGGAAPASPAGLSNPVARSANQPAPESTEKLYRSAWLKTLQGKPLTDDEKRGRDSAPRRVPCRRGRHDSGGRYVHRLLCARHFAGAFHVRHAPAGDGSQRDCGHKTRRGGFRPVHRRGTRLTASGYHLNH